MITGVKNLLVKDDGFRFYEQISQFRYYKYERLKTHFRNAYVNLVNNVYFFSQDLPSYVLVAFKYDFYKHNAPF